MTIVDPSVSLSPAERAHQLWSVHPNDLDRLGFTREAADEAAIRVLDGATATSGRNLGPREMFYLAHINAAAAQAATSLPEADNQMHLLRRFAMAHQEGDPIHLTPEDSTRLASAILNALTSLDGLWETIHGRKLTDEEKGIVS